MKGEIGRFNVTSDDLWVRFRRKSTKRNQRYPPHPFGLKSEEFYQYLIMKL